MLLHQIRTIRAECPDHVQGVFLWADDAENLLYGGLQDTRLQLIPGTTCWSADEEKLFGLLFDKARALGVDMARADAEETINAGYREIALFNQENVLEHQ